MPLIPGSVTITVGAINPTTGLGPSNISGVGLAKELAAAELPAQMSNYRLDLVERFYNQWAATVVAHIQTNALVTTAGAGVGTAAVTTAPGVAPVTTTTSATGTVA